MNVFKPYQVLSEIYKIGTADYVGSEDWKKSSGSGTLLLWWIFWVITHIIMTVIGIQVLKIRDDPTLNQIIDMYYGSITACAMSLIVAGLWFVVAGSLTRRLLNRSVSVVDSVVPVHVHVVNEPAASAIVTNFTNAAPNKNPSLSSLQTVVDEDHIYTEIARELESSIADKGLWIRLFAECGGDEKQTKILYIKQRAERLIAAEQLRLEQAKRSAAATAKIAEIRRQREAETQRRLLDRTATKPCPYCREEVLATSDYCMRCGKYFSAS